MQTNELREKYLQFFETKGCVRKPSDVLVPKWDPSVLFTPAGMNQFKDHFLGRVKLEFTRATTCQKCLRTGDIDNVGRTAYHHTFFEMLGNFSFGDYFKKEAIHWAWEFLTDKKWLGIDPGKLSVTVYKDDHEAAKIWFEEIGIPQNRLKYLEEDENFWPASAPSLGPDGVCGPCSEIYHDTPVGAVEIWNLVFTQFNRVGNPPNNLQPLPSNNIDTGMGLERCAAVLQGVETNYHIDILRPLVETAAEVLGMKYEPGTQSPALEDAARRMRRIADHIRACTFAVHENVYPGNKEEKYVIRRLLRRAVLDGRQLGYNGAFLHLLVPKVAEMMKVPYPELSETITRVAKVIETEEEHFIGTVDSGLEKIERIFANQSRNRKVAGADIFDMYQTFGFPPELFETMASERGFSFDWDGFKQEMERHGEISGSAEKNLLFKEDVLEGIKKTHKTEFVGYEYVDYDTLEVSDAKVLAILVDGKLVDRIDIPGTQAKIVLDKTPFYGEKGGQVGDEGGIAVGIAFIGTYPLGNLEDSKKWYGGNGRDTSKFFFFAVEDTQIDGEVVVHIGHLKEGIVEVGDIVNAEVDKENRQGIARAHSATHLLHHMLRLKLGDHAEQQGSKVSYDELRFDFTHHQALGKETLRKIEAEVNWWIQSCAEIECSEGNIDYARAMRAIMLFGEKYPEIVRVVGIEAHGFFDGGAWSVELCGGTHVKNTSEIGMFKIISEESVASGVRRITALTGMKAYEKTAAEAQIVQQLASTLKVPADDIVSKVESLAGQVKQLQKEVKAAGDRRQAAAVDADALIQSAENVSGIKLIVCELDIDVNAVRQLIDQIKQKTTSVAMLFAVKQKDKVMLLTGISSDLTGKYDAQDWVKSVVPLIGGKGGGGRPDFAQSGGSDASKLPEVFAEAKKYFG